MTHPYAKFKDGGAAKAAQYVKPYAGGGEVAKLLKKLASTAKKDYVKETKEPLKDLAKTAEPKGLYSSESKINKSRKDYTDPSDYSDLSPGEKALDVSRPKAAQRKTVTEKRGGKIKE